MASRPPGHNYRRFEGVCRFHLQGVSSRKRQ